ncbi:MAG: hypothetical protein ACFB4I_07580 [Cyanophyceae cyanobacterium]
MIAAFKFSLRWVRLLVVVCFCALLLTINVRPAAAIDSYKSNPAEGETQLNETIRKTEEVSRSKPRSMQEQQGYQEGKAGLNAVQGTADAEKMSRPENSSEATSVETKIKEGLRDFLE